MTKLYIDVCHISPINLRDTESWRNAFMTFEVAIFRLSDRAMPRCAAQNEHYHRRCKPRLTERPREFTGEKRVPRNIPKNISVERATRATSHTRSNFRNVLALLGALTKPPLAPDRVLSTLASASGALHFNFCVTHMPRDVYFLEIHKDMSGSK